MLLASFANALAHKIRTPLAVITNELSFLASQGQDCARAIQRSKDIAQILKIVTSLGSATVRESQTNLAESISKVFSSIKSEAAVNTLTDSMHLEATLRLIKMLLQDLSANEGASPEQLYTATFDASLLEATLQFECVLHDPISVEDDFDSLTELFSKNLHLDLIEPPLIDAGAAICKAKLKAKLIAGKFNLTVSWKAIT